MDLKEKLKQLKKEREQLEETEILKQQIKEEEKKLKQHKRKKNIFVKIGKGIKEEINKYEFKDKK